MALSVVVRHPAFRTRADHSADRDSVQNAAVRCSVARRQFRARVHTLIPDTRQSARAVDVQFALVLSGDDDGSRAVGQGVSFGQMRRTEATGRVVLHVTDCVLSAGRIGDGGAWIDASLLDASPVVGTVRVDSALDSLAAVERIAVVA